MADEQELFKVTIDGITIEVPKGTTILNAARKIGPQVAPPAMCYYSKLEGSGGKCRTCLVEVAAGSNKRPTPDAKIGGFMQNRSDGWNDRKESNQ